MKLFLKLIFYMHMIMGNNLQATSQDYVNILVYTKTSKVLHESIDNGVKTLKLLETNYPFTVIHSEDSLIFSDSTLAKFDVVVFLNTSEKILDDEGRMALQNFIQRGGGFVGIHSASASEYEWAWYGKLIGAYFDKHPKIQTADIKVIDSLHISTKHLPTNWQWKDEWYNWRSLPGEHVNVLLTVDESTYTGGKHSEYHPIAWCHEFEGGRSWYTALGHLPESYNDENYVKHLLGGIIWAANRENEISIKRL